MNATIANCANCVYFKPNQKDQEKGACRQKPPEPIAMHTQLGAPAIMGMWPPVRSTDWCGQWEPESTAWTKRVEGEGGKFYDEIFVPDRSNSNIVAGPRIEQ